MATTTAPLVTAAKAPIRWFPLALAVAVGAAIFLIPASHGLSRTAQTALAITGLTVVLWATQAMNNGVASVLMMALMVGAGIKPSLAFSGFSSGSFWVLLAVLFYGFAMKHTGLAQRISFHILSLFPSSYPGILGAFFAIGALLSLGIPSMTVRTVVTPGSWAIA